MAFADLQLMTTPFVAADNRRLHSRPAELRSLLQAMRLCGSKFHFTMT